MKEKNTNINKKVLLSALLLIVVVVSAFSVTFARYQKNKESVLEFTVGETAGFDILSDGEWVKTEEGGRKLTFTVTNLNNAKDSRFKIKVLSTIALSPETSEVMLTVANNSGVERSYTGVAVAISEEDELYEQMGPGYTFTFVDESGDEPVWELAGGTETTEEFTLNVSGFSESCLIELVVSQVSQQ